MAWNPFEPIPFLSGDPERRKLQLFERKKKAEEEIKKRRLFEERERAVEERERLREQRRREKKRKKDKLKATWVRYNTVIRQAYAQIYSQPKVGPDINPLLQRGRAHDLSGSNNEGNDAYSTHPEGSESRAVNAKFNPFCGSTRLGEQLLNPPEESSSKLVRKWVK